MYYRLRFKHKRKLCGEVIKYDDALKLALDHAKLDGFCEVWRVLLGGETSKVATIKIEVGQIWRET